MSGAVLKSEFFVILYHSEGALNTASTMKDGAKRLGLKTTGKTRKTLPGEK